MSPNTSSGRNLRIDKDLAEVEESPTGDDGARETRLSRVRTNLLGRSGGAKNVLGHHRSEPGGL